MRRAYSWIIAVLILGAIAFLLLGIADTFSHIDFGFDANENTRVTFVALIYGSVFSAALFGTFLALSLQESDDETRSAFLSPLVSTTGFLYAYLLIAAAQVTDILINDRREWAILYDPDFRAFSSLLLVGFVGSLAWLLGVMLVRSRELSVRRFIAACAIVALVVGGAIILAVSR